MAIEIKSFNQILGGMIRKILAETPLNDINAGSVLLTLLEAAAANDYENNTAILNVLELLNIDAIKNNDLDAKASDFGLARRAAIKASGLVTISNSNITKKSTGLYVIKPAPIAGQTKLYVNTTVGWATSGTLYIGRGTQNFEGPIAYSSIIVYPTYSEITLSSALQKDHLISDIVIDSQGEPDRLISAGTVVKIPANNQNPEIQYVTLRNAVIPAGEDTVSGVEVIALVAGSLGNAGINTITSFDAPPFAGASVSNVSAFSNGKNIETDVELRNRLKSYAITLARGTAPSIIASIVGVSDPDDSNQVASAILTEPTKIGNPSILYIDDGFGLQPSFAGQSVDILLNDASGKEEFLQLANYPVPRPQVINADSGPFTIKDGSFLRVIVDGEEETVYFSTSQFLNISAATLAEVIVAINANSTLFKARFVNQSSNMLLYPVAHDAETIQVSELRSTDDSTSFANSLFKFPTEQVSYIALYQNSTRLHEKAKSAELTTTAYAQWNIVAPSNIIISVDDTPSQDRLFTLSDFAGASSFTALTINDWVTAFNAKFAGLTAEATPSQTLIIRSNKTGSLSKIVINGGTLLNKWFPNLATISTGQTAQFELNRQTGNIRILTKIKAGDSISAGVEDAKGFSLSTSTVSGNYNFSTDIAGRPAEMVIVVDSNYCNQKSIPLLIGSTISISNPSASTMRIMSSTLDAFATVQPSHFIYITKRTSGWVNAANTGLFKIKAKGNHTTANVNTFIDVDNVGVIVESGITVADSLDIKGFETDGFPQVWRGSYLTNPPSEPITGVIASFNKDLQGILATIYKSNAIKITSATENGGNIAIPVSIGSASVIFSETANIQSGNPSHVATRISNKTMFSMFKRTTPTDVNVFLNRHIYSDIKGALTTDSAPDSSPFSNTYSETVESIGTLTQNNVDYDDYLSFHRGNNRNQYRTVKAKIATDKVGTQQSTARTEIDHVIGDEIELVRPVAISSDDSIVLVIDKDPTIKTVDIQMSRTGRVNSGSGIGLFNPTTTEFSAFDQDNEPGIDFNNLTVWGKTINNTDFSDYAIWMRARNWYATGGVASSGGKMVVRSSQYGANGNKLRFSLKYPSSADQSPSTSFSNTPSWSLYSYFFGSGSARPITMASGDSIHVTGPYPDTATNFPSGAASTGNYYDYTFSAGTFAPVTIGDILSISSGSGVSNMNSGQFKVMNKSGLTVRVFNPNATTTTAGSFETVDITTIDDIGGSPTAYYVHTTPDLGGSLHQTYFIVYDTQGSVAVWYDINNSGALPPPHGANRAIKVSSVITGDTAPTIATKTGITLATDAFWVDAIGNTLTLQNINNGPLTIGNAGTTGFTLTTTVGVADITVNGKYFTLHDENGSVAVWYDNDSNGTAEPFHGCDRSIRVTGVPYPEANVTIPAATVAAATVAALNPDLSFSASNISNIITVVNSSSGNMTDATIGTTSFSISITNGALSGDELITNANSVAIFPLIGTDVNTIVSTVNNESIIELTAIGSGALTIETATKEDEYSYSGDATALAFGHNPTSSSLRDYIALYDGINWVKEFNNINPNFVTKDIFTLNGVAPSVYQMNTAPNYNTTDIGEYFKLIPVSIKNVHHHLTQKALSQLPIVSNVRISDDRRNIQITSKQLGSAGAIEVVGGNANKAQAYTVGESEIATDTTGKYLLVKIPAFPDTFNIKDLVKIENDAGVKRLSRLLSSDSIDVTNPSTSVMEYNFNPKTINTTATTEFTINDVSATYGRPANFVWRWTHDGSATLSTVVPGDQVFAFGNTIAWDQGNKVMAAGDGAIAGLPIIAVNDGLNYFDVINPHGRTMGATAIGVGNTIQICPTPIIKWNLAHATRIATTSMIRVSNTVSVIAAKSHMLNTGDMIDIIDSDNLVDASYGPIIVTSPNQFTFTASGSNFTEITSGASLIKSGLVPTRYRFEKLNYNGLVKISRQDGESPRFTDCGVAVDDYVVIGGSTFKANNNGRFRVLAVDNNSIIIENSSATDELNTTIPFNNKSLVATWTANTNFITGSAGTFKNLNVGDWVKKPEDPDSYYQQVISFTPSTSDTATLITLGGNYAGSTALSAGVSYDQLIDYDKGIILQGIDDITFYEGDAAASGDTLFIQNIVNTSWFSVNNVGNFIINEVGTNSTTYKPFIRITNTSGIAETNRSMAINTAGFYIIESLVNKFSSIRQISNVAIDQLNVDRRALYLTPYNRSYKFSESNATSITHMGKLGYDANVTAGIDGYLYYTGLLRRVQRIVDGYEPDAENFPGRRAVGGAIETLPPLNRRINIAVNITTNEGVNLGDISNNIKSVIINYIETLGVGTDVILSEMIAAIMQIKGVAAVTFTSPIPSTERITIANNEKATVNPNDIGIA
jgi:uncharacterized phage protein gp47/JayE